MVIVFRSWWRNSLKYHSFWQSNETITHPLPQFWRLNKFTTVKIWADSYSMLTQQQKGHFQVIIITTIMFLAITSPFHWWTSECFRVYFPYIVWDLIELTAAGFRGVLILNGLFCSNSSMLPPCGEKKREGTREQLNSECFQKKKLHKGQKKKKSISLWDRFSTRAEARDDWVLFLFLLGFFFLAWTQ